MANELSGTDPIVKEHHVARFTFGLARPVPAGSNVLVWKAMTGERLYPVKSPPTAGELMMGSFCAYEVDVAQHPVKIEYDLPTNDSAMTFRSSLHAIWKVTDPIAVVHQGVRNAEAVHEGWLKQLLRDSGSQYSIFDQHVEQKINAELARCVGHQQYGISIIDLRIEISLDTATSAYVQANLERARAHETRLTDARNAGEVAVAQAGIGMETAQHEEQLRSLQRLYQQEDEARQAAHQQKLAQQEAEHALKLKQMRMEFYGNAFRYGDSALFVLQLTEHPEDVATVINFLSAQRNTAFENSNKMLKALIDADVINPDRLDDALQLALGNVLDELRPATGGLSMKVQSWERTAAIEDTAAPAPSGIGDSSGDSPSTAPKPTPTSAPRTMDDDADAYE